jgi:prepilin-type N-terminal cleavage/methylation domain-containing protein
MDIAAGRSDYLRLAGGHVKRHYSNPGSGFTLIEIVVSVVVFSIMMAAFFVFYRSQALALAHQELFINAKENAQIGIDFMMREIRTAGARPVPETYPPAGCAVAASTDTTACFGVAVSGGNSVRGFPSFASANGTSLRMLTDYRDATSPPPIPDGCPDDPNEDITYTYTSGTGQVTRQLATGTPSVVLDGIEPNGFRFRYYGYALAGSPPAFEEFQSGGAALTAAQISRLTHITITVTTRANARIPGMGPIRSTQTTTVDVRNPAC